MKTHEIENARVLDLIQASIGAVSPNFRRIALRVTKPRAVELLFLLERESPEDREEIEDIAFEFEALQDGPMEIAMRILVDTRPVHAIEFPGRVVFGRRER